MCISRTNISMVDLLNLVTSKVNEFVKGNSPFTAFDITKALRDGNPTIEIDHNEVKVAVDSMHRRNEISPNYVRTTVTMQNGRTALVYHDANTDPTTHPYADKGTVADPTDGGAPADTADDSDTDPDVVEITKESRLNICQSLLRKVGLNVNSTAYLYYNDTDNKVFLAAVKPSTNNITEYVVSKTGELRVAQVHLVKKFGTSSQFYKVTTDAGNSAIEIEPVAQN